MALIWAEGFDGDRALSRLWRAVEVARRQRDDEQLSHAHRGAALTAMLEAKQAYDQRVGEANTALKSLAQRGQARTHVMVAGVAAYDSSDIDPLETAVFGARAFSEWVLTRLCDPARPLGSLEFLSSPRPAQGDWTPGPEAARRLGLMEASSDLPSEPAALANIQTAFENWMARAGTLPANAAFLYMACHGLLKSELMLCPQDARLPSRREGANNLIAPLKTLSYLQNRPPDTQCYFLDCCSEPNVNIAFGVEEVPAQSLVRPSTAAFRNGVDLTIFVGSRAGRKAYGPANDAPFFTRELMQTLERRAADSTTAFQHVTTSSLEQTLAAAGPYRSELEKNLTVEFSSMVVKRDQPAVLCRAGQPNDVFLKVNCDPKEAMQGKLYVTCGQDRQDRAAVRDDIWHTLVPHRAAVKAGVEFQAGFIDIEEPVDATPPVWPVPLAVSRRNG
jgi:hypothetical protein